MDSYQLSQRVVFLCFIVTLILIHTLTSLCADDHRYVNCSQNFNCSGHENLTYPFWGSKRPKFCGHPDFELRNCTEDEPVITMKSLDYIVVDVNQSTKSLVVARADYWENACPTELHNTSVDIGILNFVTGSSQDLTLYYKCPPPLISPPNILICDINGTMTFNYIATESIQSQIPTDDINSQTCNETVLLRISSSEITKLTSNTTLVSVLKAGFGLTWDDIDRACDRCKQSGGHCGSDQNSGVFACYCKDGPQSSNCDSGSVRLIPFIFLFVHFRNIASSL